LTDADKAAHGETEEAHSHDHHASAARSPGSGPLLIALSVGLIISLVVNVLFAVRQKRITH
jgi:hypothetical protein